MLEVSGYHCQGVERLGLCQLSGGLVHEFNMWSVKCLWIVLIYFVNIFTRVGGIDEVFTLLMVPSGGRYDPGEIWDANIADLVGVNDCIDDENLTLTDLALKGTYRNSRRFNMTEYLNPRIQFIVYDHQGTALIELDECPFADSVSCNFGSETVTNGQVADGDGYKLYKSGSTNTLVAVFNPRRYIDAAADGMKILLSKTLEAFPDPGYLGCKSQPPSGETTITQNSMSRCYTACSTSHFALSGDKCYCVSDPSSLSDESTCQTLCPGETEQLCGGASAASVFDRTKYTAFLTFFDDLTNATQKGTTLDMTDDGTKKTLTLPTPSFISAAMVEIEEECHLTNLYFDTAPVQFNLEYNADCGATTTMHTTLTGTGEMEQFDSVSAKCVYLVPESFNYTYPRARISVYGPDGATVDVTGMFVINGIYEIPESSSPVPSSSIDPSSSMDLSSSMEMSSADNTLMPSTVMGTASIETMMTSGMDNTPTAVEATPTISNPLEATTAVAPTEATIQPTGSVMSASASVDPGTATTTPDTGVATSTTRAIYSRDGRIIFESCTCVCKLPPLKVNQTRLEQAVEKGNELSEELQVNTKNLSATIRKKESAKDDRESASAGGYVACILLSMIGVLFLAADALSIAGHIQMLKSNLSSAFGKAPDA